MVGTEETNIYLMLLAGTMGMFILAGAVVLFFIVYQKKLIKQQLKIQLIETEHQQDLLNSVIETQELERKRFAEDLHDEIGANLSATKLILSSIGYLASNNPEIEEQVNESKKVLDSIITNIRRISRDLLPATLDSFGLIVAIQELCAIINKSSSIKIDFEFNQEIGRLSNNAEISLYRITQEIINNAIKHAECSIIVIKLRKDEENLSLIIKDNGKGFNFEQNSHKGLGMRNIESRTKIINAKLSVNSNIGQGSEFNISYKLQ